MSRVGKMPVVLPAGVTAAIQGRTVTLKGPKGQLVHEVPGSLAVRLADNRIEVSVAEPGDQVDALHGTHRSLIQNMARGVHEGYAKELEIQGVGFKAQLQGKKLILALGFSHPVEFDIPEGITIKVTDNTNVSVSGADKQLVGNVGARLKAYFPAEPYKGKGVRFKGEYVRRKAGKTVA